MRHETGEGSPYATSVSPIIGGREASPIPSHASSLVPHPFSALRAQFPSAQKCIHLNHAGTSPIAQPVADAVSAVLGDLMSGNAFTAYAGDAKRHRSLRAALGRMMNVSPETLAFTRNTSHGISIAAQAIPFAPGDAVIAPAGEYPANVYPWMAQAHRGVRVHLVPPREDGYIAEEDFIAACEAEKRARVLAVPWVHWGTGQRLDLARLGAFCRERSILLAADIVQGLGALRIDLGSLPVDIAAASSHKWLLAPGGVGILYVRPGLMPDLLPVNIGWNSVRNGVDWDRLHYDDLKQTPDRFEEGTPNILGIAALDASVALLESVGFDAIERRILTLADHARRCLAAHGGVRIFSPEHPAQRSGIVAFRHRRESSQTVLAALSERGVRAVARYGNMRFSPHAYNTEAEIEAAVQAILQ